MSSESRVYLPKSKIIYAVLKSRSDQLKGPRRFRSVVLWPDEVSTGRTPNESTDEHWTREQAETVCRMVRDRGLGGEGKVFPLATRVEEIPDQNKEERKR